jgi:hypothetical protein
MTMRVSRVLRIIKSLRYEIADALVRPLPVIMGLNTTQDVTKMPFSQGDDVVQGFSGSPDKPFRISIEHGGYEGAFLRF